MRKHLHIVQSIHTVLVGMLMTFYHMTGAKLEENKHMMVKKDHHLQ